MHEMYHYHSLSRTHAHTHTHIKRKKETNNSSEKKGRKIRTFKKTQIVGFFLSVTSRRVTFIHLAILAALSSCCALFHSFAALSSSRPVCLVQFLYARKDNFVGAIRNALNSRQNALRPCCCFYTKREKKKTTTKRNKFQYDIATRIYYENGAENCAKMSKTGTESARAREREKREMCKINAQKYR